MTDFRYQISDVRYQTEVKTKIKDENEIIEVYDKKFTIHNSQFTIHNSQFNKNYCHETFKILYKSTGSTNTM